MVRFNDLIDIYIAPHANTLEEAIFTFYDAFNVETAERYQLEEIGKIVGLQVFPDDDDLLRIFIKGQIGKNASKGTYQDVYEVWALMSQATTPRTIEYYPLEIELQTDTTLPSGYESYILEFMEKTASAGVEIQRIVNLADDTYFQFSSDTASTTTSSTQGFGDATDANRGGKFNYIIVSN